MEMDREVSHNYTSEAVVEPKMPIWRQFLAQYRTKILLCELVFCIVFAFVCTYVPRIFDVREVDIPYQITLNSGDVILDLNINQEFIDDQTIPTIWNYVINVGVVLALLIVLTIFASATPDASGELHAIGCSYIVAFGLKQLVTSSLKIYVGRLRPNFYEKCEFNISSLDCASSNGEMEARKSFPSGHASLAFVGMMMLTLALLGKAWSFRKEHVDYKHYCIRRLLSLCALLPMAFATFVAASRIVDKWHHPSDVVAGALIGATSAYYSYNLWCVSRIRYYSLG